MLRPIYPWLLLVTLIASLTAVAPLDQEGQATDDSRPKVIVPSFPNSTCPIMGKPTSEKLFTDTALGRVYLCCAPCIKKVRAAVALSVRAAYPSAKPVGNKLCPVSGLEIDEKSPLIFLQGRQIAVCCENCARAANRSIQVTLVKATNPRAVDVGNRTCPVNGKPVKAETIVLIGDSIVHLSSFEHVEAVEAAPEKTLEKARAIVAKQKQEERARSAKPDGAGGETDGGDRDSVSR